jgi:hypothetical protein
MTINDSQVVEIDLRASYLTIFYAWHGMQLDPLKDPYVPSWKRRRGPSSSWVAPTFGNTAPLRKWPSDLLKELRGRAQAASGSQALQPVEAT